MKKIITFALCVTMLFALAACGDKKEEKKGGLLDSSTQPQVDMIPSGTTDNQVTTNEPNEEQVEKIDRYYEIAMALERYKADCGFYLECDDMIYGDMTPAAALACLEELKSLDVVDQFKDSQYCSDLNNDCDFTISWDRQTYLDKFKVLKENVLLKQELTNVDHVGNVSTNGETEPWEVVEGQVGFVRKNLWLIEKADNMFAQDLLIALEEYDAAGKLTKITYRSKYGDIDSIRVPVYNEKGLRIQDQLTRDNGTKAEVNYAYDEQDRLIQIQWDKYQWDFTYDEKGNMVKQVYSAFISKGVEKEVIWEYTFNEKGLPISANETWNDYTFFISNNDSYLGYQKKQQHTFTYDDQDNMVTWETKLGDTIVMSGSTAGSIYVAAGLATETAHFTYGDLVMFEK